MNNSLKSKIRCKKYRKKILEISQSVSALHIGGSFSSVEIVDCIYNRIKKSMELTFVCCIPIAVWMASKINERWHDDRED